MLTVKSFSLGGYRYIEGVFQYSAGVVAEPGFQIERARFSRPVPLTSGFMAARDHLASLGRPLTAFCACELRSPAPFSEQGFEAFNREYVGSLERWGICRDGVNPVARTNVCPAVHSPGEVMMYAFSYTVPASSARPGFVIAGSGEAKEGEATYAESLVRPGDTSLDGLREKVRFVLGEMEARMTALGAAWQDAVSAQVYTVFDIGPLMRAEFAQRGAASGGLSWHYCRPPVEGLDFEMDVLGASREIMI